MLLSRRQITKLIKFILHSFLESMKMPATASAAVTSSKPTSTFNICDILDLNNKKKSKDIQQEEDEIKADTHEQEEEHDDEEEEEEIEKKENLSDFFSSSVDEENATKRKIRSPASQANDSQESLRKEKKSRRSSPSQPQTSSLLSDTLHQYPHLFQNHPAMRPWFSSNGEFQPFSLPLHALIEHIKRVMMNVA